MHWTTHDFPVGFHRLHPDVGINFQLNRLYNFTNDEVMLSQLRSISPSIRNYADLIRELTDLADQALVDGERLRAALYLRGADFVMPHGAPRKEEFRTRFVELSNSYYGIEAEEHHQVPFDGASLSAYRYRRENPQGTVVFLNGFDGYIEELTRQFLIFRDAGYDVIAFDGPGQGAVLEQTHLTMIPEWERPTAAVLDYFGVDDATVIGCSLGGCLALRAAAFEPRISRVVCYDILPSLFDSVLHAAPDSLRRALAGIIPLGIGGGIVNRLVATAAQRNLMVQWGLEQGMRVMGSRTPYELFRTTLRFTTAHFSNRIDQDVLLLAGRDDHYVPVGALAAQIDGLTNARSVTARLFTAEEQAANHCQLGNIGLALDTMLDWMRGLDSSRARLDLHPS